MGGTTKGYFRIYVCELRKITKYLSIAGVLPNIWTTHLLNISLRQPIRSQALQNFRNYLI